MASMLNQTHLRQHIALDVGTATIRVASGLQPVREEPSAIGCRRALQDGVVVDGAAAAEILEPLLHRVRRFGILKPCVLACAPSDASRAERQALLDSIIKAGAASVTLIPEPLAAAIGSGLEVSSPYAQMVVDIGAGVSDCAVIRSSKILATCAVRIGCDRMRRAIVAAARPQGQAGIGEAEADLLLRCSTIVPSDCQPGLELAAAALRPALAEIAETIDAFLRDLPHEVGCEIIESGICLTGGGALIPGLAHYLEQRTGIDVTVANDPRASVVEGARAIVPVIQALNQWR